MNDGVGMDLQRPTFACLGQSEDNDLAETGINSLPDEILTVILVLVPDENLKNCILVCRRWLNTVVVTTFWKEKCLRKCYILPELVALYAPTLDVDSWRNFYYLKPYSRNLIKNPSGTDGLDEWTIGTNYGEGWVVEEKTKGAQDKPNELLEVSNGSTTNFSTSYGWAEMEQVIDLEQEGCSLKLIDELQPEICISDWYTERFDCGCFYELLVQLYEDRISLADEKPLQEHVFKSGLIPQWSENNWKEVEYTFKNYGKGVRLIRFQHRGKDSQFWAGHYGSKMAGAEVRININKPSNVQ